jgi:hypothetical protein
MVDTVDRLAHSVEIEGIDGVGGLVVVVAVPDDGGPILFPGAFCISIPQRICGEKNNPGFSVPGAGVIRTGRYMLNVLALPDLSTIIVVSLEVSSRTEVLMV